MINMNRITLLIILCSVMSLACGAQTVEEKKKQINEIKKKTSIYLYGEATAATEAEAKDMAEEILYEEINAWAAEQKKLRNAPQYIISNKKDIASVMSMPRGNMHRCFVYVRKSDIQKADNIDIIDNRTPEPETPKEEFVYPEFVREIAGYTEYSKADARLKSALEKGEIKDYASATFPSNPQEYYFIIYNLTGRIIAILSPGENRTNIRTGEADSTQNYKGNKAIGFKL